MEQEFLYNGKVIPVKVERVSSESEDTYQANVEGIGYALDATRVSPNEMVLLIDGSTRRVFAASDGDRMLVHIDGHVLSFDKVSDDRKTFSKDALDFGAKDHVAAPMPGKVVKILVSEGERVTLKQPLVIVESMKMENEIKSPTDGVIKSIHFVAGDLVGTGQPIIKIEPDA